MAEDLSGKVVLVTGASSGIGRGLALALAKYGCSVIAAARQISNLHAVRDEIEGSGGKVGIVALDVSADEAAIDASVETAWNLFGGIDVLVNNAGIRGSTDSPLDMKEVEWTSVMNTNLKGSWLMTKAIGRRMQSTQRKGSIINITSIAGLERSQVPGAIAYGTSKFAANHISKVLALELGKYNIRVNAIAPGLFNTKITHKLFARDWLKNIAKKAVPVGRWGTISPDLTSLVLLLSSDLSSFVTGNVFIVDGGHTLGLPISSSL